MSYHLENKVVASIPAGLGGHVGRCVNPIGLHELLDLRPPRPLSLTRLDRLELVKVRRGRPPVRLNLKW